MAQLMAVYGHPYNANSNALIEERHGDQQANAYHLTAANSDPNFTIGQSYSLVVGNGAPVTVRYERKLQGDHVFIAHRNG